MAAASEMRKTLHDVKASSMLCLWLFEPRKFNRVSTAMSEVTATGMETTTSRVCDEGTNGNVPLNTFSRACDDIGMYRLSICQYIQLFLWSKQYEIMSLEKDRILRKKKRK